MSNATKLKFNCLAYNLNNLTKATLQRLQNPRSNKTNKEILFYRHHHTFCLSEIIFLFFKKSGVCCKTFLF